MRFGVSSKMSIVFLRQPAMLKRTGLTKSTAYRMIETGQFPKPISISERCVAWVSADVEDWCAKQIELAKQAAPPPKPPRIKKRKLIPRTRVEGKPRKRRILVDSTSSHRVQA